MKKKKSSPIFESVKVEAPRHNTFNLSHQRKFSFRMGDLVPIMLQEVLPGDSYNHAIQALIRFNPLLYPVMHKNNVTIHNFFVPERLVFKGYEDFFTGGREGISQPISPYLEVNDDLLSAEEGWMKIGSLADYMGLPTTDATETTNPIAISAKPFRAYQLIYDEYYRAQNLTPSLELSESDGLIPYGPELEKLLTLRKVGWGKDYFTTANPWAQRGPAVNIPIEAEADIEYSEISSVFAANGNPPEANTLIGTDLGAGAQLRINKAEASEGGIGGRIQNIASITWNAITSTISDLRRAFSLQRWMEKSALGGARYTETNRVMFGVTSSDARLQRPEYLGGSKNGVLITEVLSTFQDPNNEGLPQANQAGHGISASRGQQYNKTFEEHGYIISLMFVMPEATYQQGLDRLWRRATKFDYYWPDFAHIGEQELKEWEIWCDWVGNNENVWGYQSRFAEYKFKSSTVHGDMRGNLSFTHQGRIFTTKPNLNTNFVQAQDGDGAFNRIFAVNSENPSEQQLVCEMTHYLSGKRLIPIFSTPSSI